MKGIQLFQNRKAVSVMELGAIGMALVFAAITIPLGIYVNQELAETSYPTNTVTNETVAIAANNTLYDLGYRSNGIVKVSNHTYVVNSANYTTEDKGYVTAIKFLVHDEKVIAYANYNVTYSAYNSEPYSIAQNATKGLSSFAQWLPIVAIVFAAAIIVSMLVVWFSRREGV